MKTSMDDMRKEVETSVDDRPASADRSLHKAEGFDDDDLNPETHQLSDFKELCKSVASLLHIGESLRACPSLWLWLFGWTAFVSGMCSIAPLG